METYIIKYVDALDLTDVVFGPDNHTSDNFLLLSHDCTTCLITNSTYDSMRTTRLSSCNYGQPVVDFAFDFGKTVSPLHCVYRWTLHSDLSARRLANDNHVVYE